MGVIYDRDGVSPSRKSVGSGSCTRTRTGNLADK